MQPYNVKTTKKDLIKRLAEHNVNAWKNDPVEVELYALIQKFSRTEQEDLRLKELQDISRRNTLGFTSTEPVREYPTQTQSDAEKQAERVMDFTHYVNYDQPRERRWRNQK